MGFLGRTNGFGSSGQYEDTAICPPSPKWQVTKEYVTVIVQNLLLNQLFLLEEFMNFNIFV